MKIAAWFLFLFLSVVSVAAQEQPRPEDVAKKLKEYPVAVRVTSSERSLWNHPDLTCEESGKDMNCREVERPLPIQKRAGTSATLSAEVDGTSLILSCDEQMIWSQCISLPAGTYNARWTNKDHTKLTVLYWQTGKKKGNFYTQTYKVTDPHQVSPTYGPIPTPKQ